MTAYQIRNTESMSRAMDRLVSAQGTLEAMLQNEHTFTNGQVADLRRDIRSARYRITDEHRTRALELADQVITRILHVNGKKEYQTGYYRKFITDPSEMFEVRFEYTDAAVQLLKEMGEKKIPSLWYGGTRNGVLAARRDLKGKEESQVGFDNPLLKESYDAVDIVGRAIYNRLKRKRKAHRAKMRKVG
ncbi:hypothetical protein KY360_04325 [Candidatus Woesearchaeota archaeon]|nr:hypothetical protein [Candidatus Woesearchaeota archaeon]